MRRTSTWLAFATFVIVVGAFFHITNVHATPATGFVGTTLAQGRFAEFEVFNHLVLPNARRGEHEKNIWLSLQKTKGSSDVYVQSNVWQPGGSTGWHTHPGHSLIIVTAGTVTAYEGNDPSCTPTVYTAGMGFVDPGGDHVHNIRNESTTDVAQTIAVQLIPATAARRIDAPDPGNCHF